MESEVGSSRLLGCFLGSESSGDNRSRDWRILTRPKRCRYSSILPATAQIRLLYQYVTGLLHHPLYRLMV